MIAIARCCGNARNDTEKALGRRVLLWAICLDEAERGLI